MTTADALRINESMTALVDAMGIKDPQLRKIMLDQFNEEAANGMGYGLTPDAIIEANERMIESGFPPPEIMEAAVREECKARRLI